MEHDQGVTCNEMNRQNAYFHFIQFSLGLYDGKEFLSGEVLKDFDWEMFFLFAKTQTLLGVVFDGIQRLSKDVAPGQDLLMKWFGLSQRIKMQNVRLNEATGNVYQNIRSNGFRCCILKGQGNALMYPNPYARTSGDVDVWVNASRKEILQLAHELAKGKGTVGKESLNHVELTVGGIPVELHSTPAIMNNPIHNHRLQKWLKRNLNLQCSNLVSLPDGVGEVTVPTNTFNAVYQLFHLYHHFFYEGVGLRQVIDYYYVVSMSNVDSLIFASLQRELKHLGLWKFAGAVMYVLHEVLGLSEEKMIAPIDEKRGKMLLEEIMVGGNFGQYDERYGLGKGFLGHNAQRFFRDLRLVRFYPAEALSEPMFRTWHFFWRMKNKK